MLPQYARYVALQTDGIKAAYRQQVWWDTDWKQMVYSYGVMKPQRMIESVFYWDQALDQTMESVQDLQRLDLYLCIGVIAALSGSEQNTGSLCSRHDGVFGEYLHLRHDLLLQQR